MQAGALLSLSIIRKIPGLLPDVLDPSAPVRILVILATLLKTNVAFQ